MLGMCPRSNELHLAGEDCRESSKGIFFITTNPEAPFASGQWTIQPTSKYPPNSRRDPFLEKIDEYGKLDSTFNFANNYHKLSTSSPQPISTINFRPFGPLTNEINHNEFDTAMNANNNLNNINHNHNNDNDMDDDKSRFDLYDDDLKLGSTTQRWRQNDKFILVENPLASALNRTLSEALMHHQHSDSSDEFQFPKVTYR